MKIRNFCLTLVGALLVAGCVPSSVVPPTPSLDVALPVSGAEEVWNAADYQGKPVLLAVMATWCPWCKKSLSALDATSAAYDGQVEVVGIFIEDDDQPVEQVKKDFKVKSKILYGGGEAAQDLGVQGFPHIMLFDKNHKLVRVWSGYADDLANQYKTEIDKLLK